MFRPLNPSPCLIPMALGLLTANPPFWHVLYHQHRMDHRCLSCCCGPHFSLIHQNKTRGAHVANKILTIRCWMWMTEQQQQGWSLENRMLRHARAPAESRPLVSPHIHVHTGAVFTVSSPSAIPPCSLGGFHILSHFKISLPANQSFPKRKAYRAQLQMLVFLMEEQNPFSYLIKYCQLKSF